MQIACLDFYRGEWILIVGGLFYNVCSLTFFIEHDSLKQLVKFATNRINSFVISAKQNKKKNFTPFPHIMASRYKGYVTKTSWAILTHVKIKSVLRQD